LNFEVICSIQLLGISMKSSVDKEFIIKIAKFSLFLFSRSIIIITWVMLMMWIGTLWVLMLWERTELCWVDDIDRYCRKLSQLSAVSFVSFSLQIIEVYDQFTARSWDLKSFKFDILIHFEFFLSLYSPFLDIFLKGARDFRIFLTPNY
jgi:hypothetical protein